MVEDLDIESLRPCEMTDFKNDPDRENLPNTINWEATRALQAQPKY